MEIISGLSKCLIKSWCPDLEEEALSQIMNVANLPFIFKHVAVMPDAHAGKGSTVGTVIATRGAIIPSCVGVDIGCGMQALKLPFKIDAFNNLNQLRSSIERSVPVGFNQHKILPELKDIHINFFNELNNRLYLNDKTIEKSLFQLGTLGGGNHFIELCHDENNDAWIVLHSGSRNIGKSLADIHINGAKGLMRSYFIEMDDLDLSYLAEGTQEFKNYIQDLNWAQYYAKHNRYEMMDKILKDISYHLFGEYKVINPDHVIDCHHNYTHQENHYNSNVWVTRKGAVSAREGEYGIIPGSMGTKSFIVKGKGNAESFCSCSHGAGRKMSRKKARESFTEQDFLEQTKNVECRKDIDVIDEIPSAYKDIDIVMNNQLDLVDIVHTLKQVLCIKG